VCIYYAFWIWNLLAGKEMKSSSITNFPSFVYVCSSVFYPKVSLCQLTICVHVWLCVSLGVFFLQFKDFVYVRECFWVYVFLTMLLTKFKHVYPKIFEYFLKLQSSSVSSKFSKMFGTSFENFPTFQQLTNLMS
jgi:hypothetical protein